MLSDKITWYHTSRLRKPTVPTVQTMKAIFIAVVLIFAMAYAEECKNCANNALRADNIEQALLNLRRSNLPGAADLTTGNSVCVSCCCDAAKANDATYCFVAVMPLKGMTLLTAVAWSNKKPPKKNQPTKACSWNKSKLNIKTSPIQIRPFSHFFT
uniref:Uncharacterized protein n=1 Tax=Panagrolaimus sp. JU765 TaxID=591449 RepID=A0AC34RQG0_9BILA